MKKRLKKVLLALGGIVAGVFLIFVAFRYGWRLFGFSMCKDNVGFESVIVKEDEVTLKCFNADSFSFDCMIGYKAKQEGDILYVGVKYNTLLGVLPDDVGSGEFTVPVKGEINQVILKGRDKELIIWDRAGNDKLTIHIELYSEDMTMLHYQCYLGEEEVAQANVAYEGTEVSLKLSKNDFPADADLSTLRVAFTAIEGDKEIPIGEPQNLAAEWGQTHEFVIAKKEGEYIIQREGISEFK
ncbi:MAG: hypothetical protein E7256_15750 [Lachnospiraceae bacterium]|nr:hypothetical protein [Lachnospiraceae bacterium]